jgi:hypothetical protein
MGGGGSVYARHSIFGSSRPTARGLRAWKIRPSRRVLSVHRAVSKITETYFFLITRLRQPDFTIRTKSEYDVSQGESRGAQQSQFQKGLSEDGFDALYGTEEQCHAKLVSLL